MTIDTNPVRALSARTSWARCLLIVMLGMLIGCASLPPTPPPEVHDPFENTNRQIYRFNDGLDRYVAAPVARAYMAVTPRVARAGVTNFFNNITYPGVVLNSALQGRWQEFGQGVTRIMINSTWGVFGLIDVATPLGLEARQRDFGQTVAGWGKTEGTYLMLPALGPSNTRDVQDVPVSALSNPLTWTQWSVAGPLYLLNLINTRANLDRTARFRSDTAIDEYAFTRSAYRQYRNTVIFDGNPPERDIFDDIDWDDLD
jgi:phospholipid-binding lipoprotein MlaA